MYGLLDLCKTKPAIMEHVKRALSGVVQKYGIEIIPVDLIEKMIKLKIYNF